MLTACFPFFCLVDGVTSSVCVDTLDAAMAGCVHLQRANERARPAPVPLAFSLNDRSSSSPLSSVCWHFSCFLDILYRSAGSTYVECLSRLRRHLTSGYASSAPLSETDAIHQHGSCAPIVIHNCAVNTCSQSSGHRYKAGGTVSRMLA